MEEGRKGHVEMAKQLDGMDRDVTSAEADLLDRVLKELEAGKRLKPKDASELERVHRKYFGDDEDGARGDPDEGDGEDPEGPA